MEGKGTIVFLIQSRDGGSWNRLCEAARRLSKKRMCYIISYSGECPQDIIENPRIEIEELSIVSKYKSSLLFACFSLLHLIKIIVTRRRHGDLQIGSFSANAGMSASLASFITNARIFCVRRGANLRRLKNRLADSRKKGFVASMIKKLKIWVHMCETKLMFSRADLLIAQTDTGLRQLQEEYNGWLPRQRAILRNNVNATWINDKKDDATSNPATLPGDVFNVCFVGRMQIQVKGIDTLIDAAERLRNKPIQFHIVGDGPDIDEVRMRISTSNLEGSVKTYGWMNNPLRVMITSDLVVVPSRVDPCPNVVLEAFAVDTPVVGANIGGIKAMLSHRKLLFDPEKPSDLRKLIYSASTDAQFHNCLLEKCRERRKRHTFKWGAEVEKIFYTSVDSIYRAVDI